MLTTMIALAATIVVAVGCGDHAEGQGGGGGGGGGQGAGRPPQDPVPAVLAPVRIGSVERTIEVVGTLYGDEEATISAKVPGRVSAILVDIGDRVGDGQPLAQIDPTDYQLVISQRELSMRETLSELGLSELPGDEFDVTKVATVERARFEAANAKAKLDRGRQLFEQQPPLISEQDFQDLETAYQVAQRNHQVAILEAQSLLAQARTRQSELEAAQQRLADTTVRAPILAGGATQAAASLTPAERFGVTQRQVSVGEYVREGDPLFRLVADQPVKLRAAVPERFVSDIATGQTVRVRVEGSPDAFEGHVSRVNPSIDPQSRTFQIEAIVPNEQRRLRPGAFARGTVVVGQDPAVTFVPESAIVSFAGIDRVYTVDAESKAVEHEVTVRRDVQRDGHVAIGEELPQDAQVVTQGNNRLAGGVPVTLTAPADAPATQP